jgi:carbohydrate binding protein with CBM4/9 domain
MRKLEAALPIIAVLVLLFLTWNCARYGYAAWLTKKAASTNSLAAAYGAVSLNPGNAEAHLLLGSLLEAYGDRNAAIRHYQFATALRPQDYVLWLQLARAQELEGDSAAIASAQDAVRLAPFYAQPHWQLGNILVRAGQTFEGFTELRQAGASDPSLMPPIIDLAWQISGGDVQFLKRQVAPQTPASYVAIGNYLKKRGAVPEAIAMFSAASELGDDVETARARRQYVAELITARRFRDAHSLWRVEHHLDPVAGLIFNPGFERESDLDQPGFGWRATNPASVTLSLDNSNPKEGSSSLRVDFNGESNPNAAIISQLVFLEPKTHYRLRLAFRSENLVSGGLPTILIVDQNDNKVLGQTDTFPQTTDGWRETTIDFTTGESTSAIQIAVQRKPCSTQQCPIFGKLWLDNFFLPGPNHVGEG